MININTIISSFDEEGTLLKWLKKVEDALKNASLKTVETVTIDDTSFKLKFVFADDTFLLSPAITCPKGTTVTAVTAESVNAVMEGSDYISVDFNQQLTKLLVELDQTKLDETPTEDSNNLVKSGGVFDALAGKLDANKNAVASVGGLVTPSQAPAAIEFVGIDSSGAQVRIQIDTNDFEIDGTTSPYTLKKKQASGGETWLLDLNLSFGAKSWMYDINFVSNGNSYNKLSYTFDSPANAYMSYGTTKAYDLYTNAWTNEAYRTITFEEAVTDSKLLAWLQSNGDKQ